jgi:hypothetical protein
MGQGFKAAYEVRADGFHEVRFFRYGRLIVSTAFRPGREDDALKVFTGTTREELMTKLRDVSR